MNHKAVCRAAPGFARVCYLYGLICDSFIRLGSLLHHSVVVHQKKMSSTHSLSDPLLIKSIDLTDSSKTDCYKSKVCDETFPLKHLKTHMEAHTKTDLVCAQCDKSFCRNGDNDYHMMAHRSDKTYTCSRCDKAFVLDGQLKKHIQTVHDLDWDAFTKTKMGCNQCYESFSSQSCFDYHMKAHNGENSLTCSRCYQPIIRGQMRLHIKNVHEFKKNTKVCKQCDKSFSSQNGFDYHMKAHIGEKLYTCSQCDKTFIIAGQLKQHIKIVHDLETPYKCNECNQKFSKSGNLKTHIKHRHNDDRLFECKQCYESFNTANFLKKHVCKVFFSNFEMEAEEGEIHNTLEEGELCIKVK